MAIKRSEAMPTLAPGMSSMFHYMDDGEVVIEQKNDVSSILRANHFQRSEQSFRYQGETMNHVARIDMVAIKNWMAQRGITKGWWREFMTDESLVNQFLNDPDNECWRTRLGKI